jgi:hypothetical protein
MRFAAMLAMVVGLSVMLTGIVQASPRYARGEDTFVIPAPVVTQTAGTASVAEATDQVAPVDRIAENAEFAPTQPEAPAPSVSDKWSARMVAEATLSEDMRKDDLFFFAEEIKYINRAKAVDSRGQYLGVKHYEADTPVYVPGTKLKVPVYVHKRVPCGDIRNWHVAVLKGSKYGVSPRLLLGIRNAENPFNEGIGYGVIAYRGTNLWVQADWSAKIVRRIIGEHAMDPLGHIGRLCNGYVGYHSDSWVKTVPYVYRVSFHEVG